MPPFQQWFVELISMLSSLLLAIAAMVGIAGLWRWRSETIGKARFEVARNMIRLALQFRDEFRSARSPITFPSEWAERARDKEESEAANRVLDEAFARGKRLERLRMTMLKINELGWEAETILGDEVTALLKPLEEVYTDFQVSFDMYFQDQYQRTQGTSIDSSFNRSLMDKIYGVESDDLSKSVIAAVDTLKK